MGKYWYIWVLWVCMGMYGYMWVSIGMYGYIWVYIGVYWYLWVYMGMYGISVFEYISM